MFDRFSANMRLHWRVCDGSKIGESCLEGLVGGLLQIRGCHEFLMIREGFNCLMERNV